MKKTKIFIVVFCMILLTATVFAQSDNNSDVKVSIVGYGGYQFGLGDSRADLLDNIYGKDYLAIASKISFGATFQLLFGLTEELALGFELGLESPLVITVESLANPSEGITHALRIIPRAVFQIGFGDLLSLDILLGARFGLMDLYAYGLASNIGFDIESRLNIAFSRNFALFVGLNYILPWEIQMGQATLVSQSTSSKHISNSQDALSRTVNALSPLLGIKITF